MPREVYDHFGVSLLVRLRVEIYSYADTEKKAEVSLLVRLRVEINAARVEAAPDVRSASS